MNKDTPYDIQLEDNIELLTHSIKSPKERSSSGGIHTGGAPGRKIGSLLDQIVHVGSTEKIPTNEKGTMADVGV